MNRFAKHRATACRCASPQITCLLTTVLLATSAALSATVVPQSELEAHKPQLEVSKSGNNLMIDWQTQPDVYYFVMGSPDLTTWIPAKLLTDTDETGSLSLGTAIGLDKGFYRLSLEGDTDSARLRADDDGDGIINLLEADAGWDAFEMPDPLDSDSDGIPDYWEQFHFGTLDHDGTDTATSGGLTLAEAYTAGTNPNTVDADGDGLSDAEELATGTDPNYNETRDQPNADEDQDGLSNRQENEDYGTSPYQADSDGDGLNDGLDSWALEPDLQIPRISESYVLIDLLAHLPYPQDTEYSPGISPKLQIDDSGGVLISYAKLTDYSDSLGKMEGSALIYSEYAWTNQYLEFGHSTPSTPNELNVTVARAADLLSTVTLFITEISAQPRLLRNGIVAFTSGEIRGDASPQAGPLAEFASLYQPYNVWYDFNDSSTGTLIDYTLITPDLPDYTLHAFESLSMSVHAGHEYSEELSPYLDASSIAFYNGIGQPSDLELFSVNFRAIDDAVTEYTYAAYNASPAPADLSDYEMPISPQWEAKLDKLENDLIYWDTADRSQQTVPSQTPHNPVLSEDFIIVNDYNNSLYINGAKRSVEHLLGTAANGWSEFTLHDINTQNMIAATATHADSGATHPVLLLKVDIDPVYGEGASGSGYCPSVIDGDDLDSLCTFTDMDVLDLDLSGGLNQLTNPAAIVIEGSPNDGSVAVFELETDLSDEQAEQVFHWEIVSESGSASFYPSSNDNKGKTVKVRGTGAGRVRLNVRTSASLETDPVVFTEAVVVTKKTLPYRANILDYDGNANVELPSAFTDIPNVISAANIILRQAGIELVQSSDQAIGNLEWVKDELEGAVNYLGNAFYVQAKNKGLVEDVDKLGATRSVSINYRPNVMQINYIEDFSDSKTGGRSIYRPANTLSGNSHSAAYKTSTNDKDDESTVHTLNFFGKAESATYPGLYGVVLSWNLDEPTSLIGGRLVAHEVLHTLSLEHRRGIVTAGDDGLEPRHRGADGTNIMDYGGGMDLDLLQLLIARGSPLLQ